MKYCSRCGAAASGNFCANCGHMLDKKELKSSTFWEKNKKRIVIWGTIITVCLVSVIVAIVIHTNIFRVGKVSKIDIGMSEKKVERILGTPTREKDDCKLWVNGEAEELAKKMNDLETDLKEAVEAGEENKVKYFTEELLDMEKKFEKTKKEYIEIFFNDGKVTSVYFKSTDYDKKAEDGVKILKSPKNVINGATAATVVYEEKKGGVYYKSSIKTELNYFNNNENANFSFETEKFGFEVQKTYQVKEFYATLFSGVDFDFTYGIKEGVFGVTGYNGENIQHIAIPSKVIYEDLEWEVKTLFSLSNSYVKSVTVGGGITAIGEWAFNGCDELAVVMIENGVTKIEDNAFNGCNKLVSVKIGDGVKTIGDSVFEDCKNLKQVTMSNNVQKIGDRAFKNCSKLQDLTLPETLTEIGHSLFYNCDSLTNMILPENITIISDYMFYDCDNLLSVTAEGKITKIGDFAFVGCDSLQNGVF